MARAAFIVLEITLCWLNTGVSSSVKVGHDILHSALAFKDSFGLVSLTILHESVSKPVSVSVLSPALIRATGR